MVVALETGVVVSLHTSQAFEIDCPQRPENLFGGAHRKIAIQQQLAEDRADFHGRSFVMLLLAHLQMARVNAAALFEKIVHSERTLVIDNTTRFVDRLVPKLRDERLYRYLVNSTTSRDARNNVSEGDHFAQLRLDSRHAIVQAPEQMDGM